MSITANAKLYSFKKMIGLSILGGVAFTILQVCWPGPNVPSHGIVSSGNATLGTSGGASTPADPIDAEIADAQSKVKTAEEALINAKAEETTALKLPETPANKPARDNPFKAREDAQKTMEAHRKTLENAQTAKKQKLEAEQGYSLPPWALRFAANTGVVFALQLLAFLSQQKEFAGILRIVANQLGIKLSDLPQDEPEIKAIAKAIPAAIESKVQEVAEPIRKEREVAVAEKSRLEEDLAAMSERMKMLGGGPKEDCDDRFCRVLLLGAGNTGKTELIHQMLRFEGNHVDPPTRENKTLHIRSYSVLHQASFQGVTQPPDIFQGTAIELTDYRGQATGKFNRTLIEKRYEADDCDFDPSDPGYTAANANDNILAWTPGDAGYNPLNIFRNSNAHYVIPSINEYYKAAFYSGSGTTYFDYATGSNTVPTAVASGTGAGTAVYGKAQSAGPADITQAGGLSYYGTMGQYSNMDNWMETATTNMNTSRLHTGGSTLENVAGEMLSGQGHTDAANLSWYTFGFRVADVSPVPVPEPGTAVFGLACVGVAALRRRRRA